METYDVIVVGLGAVGAATTRALALSGARVLGLDQFDPPHTLGSSHGDTRITRLAVGEGAPYAPLVARSHEIWRDLEAATGRELLVACGGVVLGVPGSTGQHNVDDFVGSTIDVARSATIEHELLSRDQLRERFPVFAITNESGYYEPTAGYLRAEECVRAQLDVARRAGATVRTNERVVEWIENERFASVTTETDTYHAARLVMAAGAWIGELVPAYAATFRVHRQVLYWFDVASRFEQFSQLPVFIWMHGTVPGQFVYGFPAIDGPDGGVKLAAEKFLAPTTPQTVDRTVTAAETLSMYEENVRHQFPDLTSRAVRAQACLYTVTPDFGFVIDHLPGYGNVIVASPCSGHGFKHSAAVGECVADLATTGTSRLDISSFGFDRFA